MLKNINNGSEAISNPLLIKLLDFCDKEKIQVLELAGRFGFTNLGWALIMNGKCDIRKVPVEIIRIIAITIGITCLNALILAEILSDEDWI